MRTTSGESVNAAITAHIVRNRDGQALYFDGVLEDISKRKKLEKQLRQSQKMEAIGTLAGGIAHDFNNILSAVIGFAEMAQLSSPPDSAVEEYVQQVLDAGLRAKELVKQILTFSRRGEQQLQPLKLQSLIKEPLKLLRASIPSTIEITEDISCECSPIMADPTQIHQIVINLCTNAYHAMRESGGRLSVSLVEVELREEDLTYLRKLAPGRYVKLAVRDTGGGIEPESLGKIFEPYYTTKEIGQGTGLGLAVVHGIITRLHGDIVVDSEVGRGTVFTTYFPTTQAAPQPVDDDMQTLLPTGRERILLVDDDLTIVYVNQKLLTLLGYQVTALTDSQQTLATFLRTPKDFDLLITDMTMPHMTGLELARKVLQVRPDMPIILCTGYSALVDNESAKAAGIGAFIMKPVGKSELARAVRRLLG